LAAYLLEEHQIEAELIRGDRGIFDVSVDGILVFSKYEADRFPRRDEISAALQAHNS
jgi:selT/selW/selH-like putative selenoprotein